MKELIQSLITVHKRENASLGFDDLIKGKGNGLVILLHGAPGTGKTLTAESVAEMAEKPLYRITCGDIGTAPSDVEKYLSSVFYIGMTWDCVLLLDEADAFLAERTKDSLERNAVVSVFLRELEYYAGTLILTSNQSMSFDPAFRSRIHLALHYPPLDLQARREIWSNLIRDLPESADHIDNSHLRENIAALASHNLNGRQIRNALMTARQLAHFKSEKLSYSHAVQVIETGAKFDRYFLKTEEADDQDWISDSDDTVVSEIPERKVALWLGAHPELSRLGFEDSLQQISE